MSQPDPLLNIQDLSKKLQHLNQAPKGNEPVILGRFEVQKKPIPLAFAFATENQIIDTLEGPVPAQKGDAIMTGTKGERWPIGRAKFEASYDFDLTTGFASKKAAVVIAEQMKEPFEVKVSWMDVPIQGKAGDFKLTYGPNDHGAVDQAIFYETYDILKDITSSNKNKNSL